MNQLISSQDCHTHVLWNCSLFLLPPLTPSPSCTHFLFPPPPHPPASPLSSLPPLHSFPPPSYSLSPYACPLPPPLYSSMEMCSATTQLMMTISLRYLHYSSLYFLSHPSVLIHLSPLPPSLPFPPSFLTIHPSIPLSHSSLHPSLSLYLPSPSFSPSPRWEPSTAMSWLQSSAHVWWKTLPAISRMLQRSFRREWSVVHHS